ncbi:WD40 repeat protein [Cyanidiococcus yangmingshanensis]|uniref:WD40 repeat protein n=1 Tax=Cyanidiococcus yangmingshanensis TaxID=2690220 RepID=A0A7J7IM12_9RHOD|nr:WD40 repeat protein [Cyanidiococcus yangmingshanensis]
MVAALTDRGFVHLLTLTVDERQVSTAERLDHWWQMVDKTCVDFTDWLQGYDQGEGVILDDEDDQPSASILSRGGFPLVCDATVRTTWTFQPKRFASVALAATRTSSPGTERPLEITACPAGVLVASVDGWLECISWDGETRWKVELFREALSSNPSTELDTSETPSHVQISYDDHLRQCLICFSPNWLVVVHLECGGYCRPHFGATKARLYRFPGLCRTSLEPRHGLVGLGMMDGTVRIHHMESMVEESVLSWNSWNRRTNESASAVRSLAWAPDGDALVVSWAEHGIALWSRHGCRLFSSVLSAETSRGAMSPAAQSDSSKYVDQRAHNLVWHPSAFFLFMLGVPNGSLEGSELFAELPLLRLSGEFGGSGVWEGSRAQPTSCALTTDAIGVAYNRDERRSSSSLAAQAAALLLHQFSGQTQSVQRSAMVDWRWFVPEEHYLQNAWPLRYAVWHTSTHYLAVAGAQGVALWNPHHRRWFAAELGTEENPCVCIGLAWLGPFLLVLCRQAPWQTLLSEERFSYYAQTNVLAKHPEQLSSSSSSSRDVPPYSLQVFHRSRFGIQRLSKPLRFRHRPLKMDTLEPRLLCIYSSDCTIRFYELTWDQHRSHSSMVHWQLFRSVPIRVDYGLEHTSVDGEWLESFRVLPSRVLPQKTGMELAFLLPMGAWPGSIQWRGLRPASSIDASSTAPQQMEPQPNDMHSTDTSLPITDATRAVETTQDDAGPVAVVQAVAPQEMLLLLGSRGTLFLLDPFTQAECVLARAVIRYWLDNQVGQRGGPPRPLLWVSSAHGIHAMGGTRFVLRLCNEFDPETFVFGLLDTADVLVGATSSRTRDWCSGRHPGGHAFHEVRLKGSPMLPMVLKHHLEDGTSDLLLMHVALRNAHQLQFMDALEWLLYRSVVAEPERQDMDQKHVAMRVVQMLRKFGEYEDIVVHCTRKTEAYKWPSLFALVGEPTALLEQCFLSGRLRTAACLLIVLQEMHGLQVSAFQALRLFQAALSRNDDALARELLSYLARLPVDAEHAPERTSHVGQKTQPEPWFRLGRWQQRDRVSTTSIPSDNGEASSQHLENRFLQMAKTSLSMYATELLWRFELYRLSVLAERLGFRLSDWLRNTSASRREITDFYLGITAARQQFQVGRPSAKAVGRAIEQLQAVHLVFEAAPAAPSVPQADETSETNAGCDPVALAIPLPSLIHLQQLVEAAHQAEYHSLALILETLLLNGTRILDLLRQHGDLREPYLHALSKFDEPPLSTLRTALQDALNTDGT